MRITTQMMNASAKRAGISLEGASLLNYVNGGGKSTQNALLNTLNTVQKNPVNKTYAANFEKLEKSADALTASLVPFLAEGEENLFVKAVEDRKAVSNAVEEWIEKYNSVVESLKKNETPLNDFYREMLGEAVTENEEALAAIGIVKNENETLSLDDEKLASAELDAIKKVLDGSGTFSSKVAFIAGRISDNAEANIQSYSSRYDVNGYSYMMNNSKYDFWG